MPNGMAPRNMSLCSCLESWHNKTPLAGLGNSYVRTLVVVQLQFVLRPLGA
jgi:hypothetical protein